MISVKLVSQSSGKPISGKSVSLGFDGNWLPGGVTKAQRTNSNGEVDFDVSPGKGKVYVDGRNAHEGQLAGRVVVYI